MRVGLADPTAAGPAELLRAGRALMDAPFPAEANRGPDGVALFAGDVGFIAATDDGRTLGTGATVLQADYAEARCMVTATHARGTGVADAILRRLIALAAREGLPTLRVARGIGLDASPSPLPTTWRA